MRLSTGDGKIRVNPVAIILVGLIFLGIGISVAGASTSFQQVQQWSGWSKCYSSSYYGIPLTCSDATQSNSEVSIDANGEIRAQVENCGCFESCFNIYSLSGTFDQASVNYVGCGGWSDYASVGGALYDENLNALDGWTMWSGFGCSSGTGVGQYNVTIDSNMWSWVYYNGTLVHKSVAQLAKYPKYFGVSLSPYQCSSSHAYFDNVCVGTGCAIDAVVGTLPDYHYIKKDLFNPLDSGLFRNSTLISSYSFYVDHQISGVSNKTPKHFDLVNVLTGVSYEQCTTYAMSSYKPGAAYDNPTFHVSSLAGTSAPYGQYAIKVTDLTGPVTREGDPFWYISGGASILWDKKEYVSGENPVITWTVSEGYWLPADYFYYLHVMKADGTQKIVPAYGITTMTGTYPVSDTSDYDAGDYWTYMGMTPKAGGNESIAAYDYTSFIREVRVAGYTLDAYHDIILPSVAIGFNSASTWHNTTSDASTAHYQVNNLSVQTIPVQAVKAGYQTDNFNFEPPGYGFYDVNISMLPRYIPNNTAIAGTTVIDWDHNAVPGATVNIWNATWADTSTSDAWAYYIFDNLLPASTYYVNATKTGYENSTPYTVSTSAGLEISQTIELQPLYTLTVNMVDATSGSPVTALTTVTLTSPTEGPQNATTTTGTVAFTVPIGVFTATASAPEYYGAMDTAIVTGDKTLVLSMVRNANYSAESAPATRFLTPPHSVRFLCIDMFGNPLSGINVTATGVTTTLPAWSWVTSIFGINQNETPIQNTTMTGITDSAGGITFLMLETINYQVTFTDANRSINQVRNYYPKEDQYAEVFWPQAPAYSGTQLQYSLFNVTNGTTNMDLGLLYSDTLGHTTNLTFYVEDYNTKSILYQNVTLNSSITTKNIRYTVPIVKGAVYIWGFNATVSDYRKPVHFDNFIRFAGQKRLIDLGIAESDMTDQLYNWFAVGMIVSFGAIFGRFTLKYGMPLTALWGAFWFVAGWLMTPGLLVAMAACIGIFAAFRQGQEDAAL